MLVKIIVKLEVAINLQTPIIIKLIMLNVL